MTFHLSSCWRGFPFLANSTGMYLWYMINFDDIEATDCALTLTLLALDLRVHSHRNILTIPRHTKCMESKEDLGNHYHRQILNGWHSFVVHRLSTLTITVIRFSWALRSGKTAVRPGCICRIHSSHYGLSLVLQTSVLVCHKWCTV